MKSTVFRAACFVAFLAFACPSLSSADDCVPKTFDGAWDGEVTLCQNWNADQQQRFWFTSQGSLLIPYDWFLVLEQKSSSARFADGAHMQGFHYLPQKKTALNPDGLPIGFTKDVTRRIEPFKDIAKHWLGLTCAACHTNQIEFARDGKTHKILVDGAGTMADFEGFMRALVDALAATLTDDAKFERFAANVLQRQHDKSTKRAKAKLKDKLKQVVDIRRAWIDRNRGKHPYGFARLDAIGAIFNEVATVPLDLPNNFAAADAPVSYPYLWDTPQYDRVQWNGSVENKGPGALGRNIGEVLGVFGGLEYRHFLGHRTSVDIEHLGELEALISTLQAPAWPESLLGPIDRSEQTQKLGRELFERHCQGCHKSTKAPGTPRPFKATMMHAEDIKTDRKMAENFAKRMSETGKIGGRRTQYIIGERLTEPKDQTNKILGYAVIGTVVHELIFHFVPTVKAIMAGKAESDLADATEKIETLSKRTFDAKPTEDALKKFVGVKRADSPCQPFTEPCYKARSLNGIWATAPYLHNGSVRTMRELVLPAAGRAKKFRVGSREYDPKDMGFADAGGFEFDTSVEGNSAAGHEGKAYGNEEFAKPENAEKLRALLEYLKTL